MIGADSAKSCPAAETAELMICSWETFMAKMLQHLQKVTVEASDVFSNLPLNTLAFIIANGIQRES